MRDAVLLALNCTKCRSPLTVLCLKTPNPTGDPNLPCPHCSVPIVLARRASVLKVWAGHGSEEPIESCPSCGQQTVGVLRKESSGKYSWTFRCPDPDQSNRVITWLRPL
jgi:hypothetical protein